MWQKPSGHKAENTEHEATVYEKGHPAEMLGKMPSEMRRSIGDSGNEGILMNLSHDTPQTFEAILPLSALTSHPLSVPVANTADSSQMTHSELLPCTCPLFSHCRWGWRKEDLIKLGLFHIYKFLIWFCFIINDFLGSQKGAYSLLGFTYIN